MKKREDVFYNYLKFLGAKNFLSIYQKSDISYTILMSVIQTLKFGFNKQEDIQFIVDFLINLTKTKNFNLMKKFLKKSDKEELKVFLSKLEELTQNENDLQSLYL